MKQSKLYDSDIFVMSNTTFEEDLMGNSRRQSDGNLLLQERHPNKNEFLNFLDKSYDLKKQSLLLSHSND